KGRLTVHKKNFLLQYVPSMFSLERGVREYVRESTSELRYKAPDIYERKVRAQTGTFKSDGGQIADVFEYLQVNAYSSSLLYDKLLSPLNEESSRFYNYRLDSVLVDKRGERCKILIQPKLKSTQLVSGYMWVDRDEYMLDELYMEGAYELITFKMHMEMGKEGAERLLPAHYNLALDYKLVGNHLSMSCEAWVKYKETKLYEKGDTLRVSSWKKKSHDLSNYYQLSCDETPPLMNPAGFDTLRFCPLTDFEQSLYDGVKERNKQSEEEEKELLQSNDRKAKQRKRLAMWGKVGDVLISSHSMNIEKLGNVGMSPLINPLLLQYSARNGISYQQRFIYNSLFNDGRLIRLMPTLGCNFTRKEVYVTAEAEWHYWPEKMARFNISGGNGNRIYSSVVLDQLAAYPDSIFHFDQFELEYFKDVYADLSHTIEPINGLTIQLGVSMHWRSLIHPPQLSVIPPAEVWSMENADGFNDLGNRLRTNYNSFAPRLRVEWTPGMYYFKNGRRKVNVGSRYPTFLLDYERGLKNVLGSSGGHERIEFDVQQKIKLGGIRSIGYRMGAGLFTNQEEMFFVDFANFSHRNLPGGGNDDMGGIFQLLDGRYYNSSRSYWRVNTTYESPLFILKPLNRWLGKVQQERIYAGILFMNHLKPYVELGYGIGTHLFDVGFFVSSVNGRFGKVGCSFTFELFNK
ncbi:MAG: DUF5686 family protein, partial [Phocaeicola sp.]